MSFENIVDPALGFSLDHDYGGIQLFSKAFLIAAIKGQVDIKALCEYELAARGYDEDGKWLGLASADNPVLAKYSENAAEEDSSPRP